MNFDDMMRAEIWLHERLNRRPNIETLARRLGYSASQVRRNFKACFGLSPGAYRDRLRLERAAMLLGLTEKSIALIARECGYRNHSAFSRAFQRRFHDRPRTYRESFRRQIAKRFNAAPRHYDFELKHRDPCHALLARHYGHDCVSGPMYGWQRDSQHPFVQQRKRAHKPIWLIHDHGDITYAHRRRADCGWLIDAKTADELVPPSPFRIVELPAIRYASVQLDNVRELGEALTFLQARGLPDAGESLSGAAITLTWLRSEPGDCKGSLIEVGLPLLDPCADRQ